MNSYAYDIEILPNFFSLTIVDIKDYLREFKDACNIKEKKGKTIREPIPLIQKYSVAEIKEKLNNIKKWQFYITDTDDSNLFPMIEFINRMNYKGTITHCFGYNSMSYDKLMIAGLLSYFGQYNNTRTLIKALWELSHKIIDSQNDFNGASKNDYVLKSLRGYGLPYKDIDLMRIFALNKVGKGIDAQGNTVFFSKGLKQTSINLQWYELLEYDLPPICKIDCDFYRDTKEYKRALSIANDKEDFYRILNDTIGKWDRYIIPEWIDDTMYYNTNDVFIVCEMIRLNQDEINLRYNISRSYEVDVLNSSRSNIADRLFEKFYSEFSGTPAWQWKGKSTQRTVMAFKRIILPFIQFKTPVLQNLLDEMKNVAITSIGKDAFMKEITLNNLTYTIATGGLHSKDRPRELKSKLKYIDDSSTGDENIWNIITDDSFIYVHFDIASFYPSLMVNYGVYPEHLVKEAFVNLVKWLRDTRVQAKHSTEPYIDGIPKDVLAQVLKIVINSIYGKLGFEAGDICDRLAVLNVTINGQLLIMMLCEELELNGIEVVSANTDGIVVKLYKKDKEKFDKITTNWMDITKFGADSEEYKCYINRDINNYIIEEINGKVSYKGAMNPLMYAVDLSKGYDMPIVAQAVSNYFLKGKPVLETLYECNNILDFCKTQNVGRGFNVKYAEGDTMIDMQRYVRFYCAMNGGQVYKYDKFTKKLSNMCVGQKVIILNSLDDMNIYDRNINYQYYLEEANKIIDPIKLGISPNAKGDASKKIKSGKALLKKYSGAYETLFDDEDE